MGPSLTNDPARRSKPRHNGAVTSTVSGSTLRRLVAAAWFPPVGIFVVGAILYGLSQSQPLVSLDVWSTNFLSWHLASGGGPWLDGVEIPGIDGHELEHVWVLETPDGHRAIGRSPGAVVAGIPAYWLLGMGHGATLPGGITAAVLTAITLVLFYLAIRSRLQKGVAVLATAALGVTTPVWTVAANGVWPHTVTILGIAGMAWGAHRDRWWLVGLFGGVVVWGRLHAAVIVAIVGLGIALSRRSPRPALVVGSISLGFLGLLCVWDRWMYGSWSPMASYEVGLFVDNAADKGLGLTDQVGMWISVDRGILVWTPVILFLLPALVRSWRTLPDWSRWLLVGGVVYTIVQAALSRYSGGDSFFPYRLTLELLVCAAPALALSVPQSGHRARFWMGPVLALQGAFMLAASGLLERVVPGAPSGGWMPVLGEDHRTLTAIAMLVIVLGLGLGPAIVSDLRRAPAAAPDPHSSPPGSNRP